MQKNVNTFRICEQISKLNYVGNTPPKSWNKYIVYTTSDKKQIKVDRLAKEILADICAWHRLTEIKDNSGKIIDRKIKFNGDKLYKKNEDYAEEMGCSVKMLRASIALLVKLGLIEKELRNIKVKGMCCNNVMYLTPIPEKIDEITIAETIKRKESGHHEEAKSDCTISKRETKQTENNQKGSMNFPKGHFDPPQKGMTNTKNITKINTKNNEYLNSINADENKNYRDAFYDFTIDCSSFRKKHISNRISEDAELFGLSLEEIINSLEICIDKDMRGDLAYLTGIFGQKSNKEENIFISVREYLRNRLRVQMDYIKQWTLDFKTNIIYYSIVDKHDKEDKIAVRELFRLYIDDIQSEFGIQLAAQQRL